MNLPLFIFFKDVVDKTQVVRSPDPKPLLKAPLLPVPSYQSHPKPHPKPHPKASRVLALAAKLIRMPVAEGFGIGIAHPLVWVWANAHL